MELYVLAFTAGVAVTAVLMWYYVGLITKNAKSPKSRLEYNSIAIVCALIKAGTEPLEAIETGIGLAVDFGSDIDLEAKKPCA